jgi:AcrR family transcriptional regulator
MKENAVDRRIARTRTALQHALLSLIVKKGYDAITVEDICHEANIGRSTFYLHYASKDALKRNGLEHLRRELADRQKTARASGSATIDGGLGFGLALLEHAREHIDLYRALAGSRGGGIALDGIREILSDLVRNDLTTSTGESPSQAIPRELVVQYVVGAYMAVLTWWLDRGATLSPRRIDAMLRRLTTNGIAQSI